MQPTFLTLNLSQTFWERFSRPDTTFTKVFLNKSYSLLIMSVLDIYSKTTDGHSEETKIRRCNFNLKLQRMHWLELIRPATPCKYRQSRFPEGTGEKKNKDTMAPTNCRHIEPGIIIAICVCYDFSLGQNRIGFSFQILSKTKPNFSKKKYNKRKAAALGKTRGQIGRVSVCRGKIFGSLIYDYTAWSRRPLILNGKMKRARRYTLCRSYISRNSQGKLLWVSVQKQ